MEMDQVVPFGDEKLAWVAAAIGAMIINRLNSIAQTMPFVKFDKPPKIVKPRDFIFWDKPKSKRKTRRKKPTEKAITPRQAQMLMTLRGVGST